MDILMVIVYILILIIFALVAFSVMQIKLAGMKIKDFLDFIQATQVLDNLYKINRNYEKMSRKEQIVFLMQAEKIFSAFDKIPNELWEDEYQKYNMLLDVYRNIKISRWNTQE